MKIMLKRELDRVFKISIYLNCIMNDVINATKMVAIVSNLARPRSLGAWTPSPGTPRACA